MGVDLVGWNVAVGLEQLPCLDKVGPIDWKVFLVSPSLFIVCFFRHLSVYRVSRRTFYAEQLWHRKITKIPRAGVISI
jgi:hypothetical protein